MSARETTIHVATIEIGDDVTVLSAESPEALDDLIDAEFGAEDEQLDGDDI